jgi:hypothetical protein
MPARDIVLEQFAQTLHDIRAGSPQIVGELGGQHTYPQKLPQSAIGMLSLYLFNKWAKPYQFVPVSTISLVSIWPLDMGIRRSPRTRTNCLKQEGTP